MLNRELENRQGVVGRLELLLRERLERIDSLNSKLEQLREQNRRLDQENEHLAEMIQFEPQHLRFGVIEHSVCGSPDWFCDH